MGKTTAISATVDPEDIWIRISDLKQYTYCPRIPFYTYVMPVPRKISYKMDYGKSQHDVLEQLEKRRTLQRYGLDHGERVFHQYLVSRRLKMSGKLDLLIRVPLAAAAEATDQPCVSTELIPVEFKYSSASQLNHKYQVAGYALLLDELMEGCCRRGFVYLIPQDELVEIVLTPGVKGYARRLVRRIRCDIATQRFPEATRRTARCRDCEFRQYCNDVEPERE